MENEIRHEDSVIRSLGELLDRQGHAFTERTFITAPETGISFTFGRYRRAVREFADTLREKGMAGGERVAVVLTNGLNAAVAILGIMVGGGVAVPVNPQLKGQEMAWLLENSAARLLVADRRNESLLPDAIRKTDSIRIGGNEPDNPYLLHRISGRAAESADEAEPILPTWNDPALILYTSGTTGRPKGVPLTHGNLLTNAGQVRRAHRLTPDDVALCVLPVYHINGFVMTLIAPLLSGAGVVMPNKFSASRFWEWVRDHRVTWFSAVPTILSLLLSHDSPPREEIATLRFARSASAPLPVAVLDEFERRFGVPVIESYGMSEAAGQITSNPLPPLPRKPGSAGMAVGNELAVVDEKGALLPAGNAGEVVLRGENICGGYLDNPEASREAFRNTWFHTGDLGYLDEDGYLFLTGRKKELINRAGEKISPREIEEIIYRLPEVETAGVVGVPDPLYGEEVTAFVSLRRGKTVAADRIRDVCREHLAGFKVPHEIFFIDEFPRGPNGKIQRRRLLDVYEKITAIK